MIENFQEKYDKGKIELDFAESGNIAVLERKFDRETGVKVMTDTMQTSTQHLNDLYADNERQLAPFLQKRKDIKAMKIVVAEKEAERDAMIEENENK